MTAHIKIYGNLVPCFIYACIGRLIFGVIDSVIGLRELTFQIDREFIFDENGKPLDKATIEQLLN